MHAIADTETLVMDGVITLDQAGEIEARARQTMVALAINAVLTAGIIAATFGLIFWLADPISVAILGVLMLIAGVTVLVAGATTFYMFGNAAALIGAGLPIGGASAELLENHVEIASLVMLITGLAVTLVLAVAFRRELFANPLVLGPHPADGAGDAPHGRRPAARRA